MLRRTSALLCLAAAQAWSGQVRAATKVFGAVVPDDARQVGEGRFQSTKDWEKTLQFFRTAYGARQGVVWRPLETNQKASGYHLENTEPNRSWDGINLYRTEDGKVWVYVLEVESKDEAAAESTKSR